MIRGGLLISFRLQLVFLWLPTSFLLAFLLVTSFLVTRFHSNRPQTSSLSLGGRLLTAPRWGDPNGWWGLHLLFLPGPDSYLFLVVHLPFSLAFFVILLSHNTYTPFGPISL
jgi:hypothetical protein